MKPALRNVILAISVLFVLHLMYMYHTPSLRRTRRARRMIPDQVPSNSSAPANEERPRAAFFVLCRNEDLAAMKTSMRELEDRFNRDHLYDWVFLSDKNWTDEFIEMTSAMTKAKTKYGVIQRQHWSYPEWINKTKLADARAQMKAQHVVLGGIESYNHMCRFNSGFFFLHELLKDYEFYWRVEPGVKFFCDVTDDPFVFMKKTGKKYGFNISIMEALNTIPTLWDSVKEFMAMHPEHLQVGNALEFISNDGGDTYNLCYFYNNFEIASIDIWKSKAYMDYFEHLDKKGGFFYERWGDAPVHTIAAALFLKKEEIHFFNDIGYQHQLQHCPEERELQHRCLCDVSQTVDRHPGSCSSRWKTMMELK